jgi:hypothetical protein
MFFHYYYQENSYRLFVSWTSAEEHSTVFREIVHNASERHGFDVEGFPELAEHLDALTDKLYAQIYSFTDEYEAVPFDPRFRRIILRSLLEIQVIVRDCMGRGESEDIMLLGNLFMNVVDKLRELVDVYLEERAYQSKFRERLRHKEQYIETTQQNQLSFEFESVLLQMIDLSRYMECLTEKQRQRLVKHVFLKYTMQEIALQEGVSHVMVVKSIAAALKKIKAQIS